MAFSETAVLSVTMALKDAVTGPARKISSAAKGLEKDFARTNKSLATTRKNLGTGLKIGAGIAGAAIGFLALQVKDGIDSLSEAERTSKLTAAAIKSTGGVAHVTAQQINDLAQAMEDKTTIDDKDIAASETLLLRFTNVRNELGKGNDIYTQAVKAALDLSAATGKSLTDSMTILGKSLNDPVKGMGLLKKAGLTFTAAEVKQIKSAKTHAQVLAAQKLELKKLTTAYGGSAVAAADTYTGSQNRLKDAVEEVRKKLAKALMPAIQHVSEKLAAFLNDPKTLKAIEDFGTKIAGLFSSENIGKGAQALQTAFDGLKQIPWATVADGLKLSGQVVNQAFQAFKSLPPDMQKAVIGALALNKVTGGLASSVIMDLAGIALKSLTSIIATSVTVIGKSVTSVGGGGGGVPVGGVVGAGGAAGAAGGAGLLGGLVAPLAVVAGQVTLVATAAAGILQGVVAVDGALGDNTAAMQMTATEQRNYFMRTGTGQDQLIAQGLTAADLARQEVIATILNATKTGEQTSSLGLQMGLNRLATEATNQQIMLSRGSERDSAGLISRAVDNTTATVRNKQWTTNVSTTVTLSVRDVNGQLATSARYGQTKTAL